MTVRINKQKINLREKLAGVEDKVNFDEVVRGLGEYTGNVGIGVEDPGHLLHIKSIGVGDFAIEGTQPRIWFKEADQTDLDILMRNHAGQFRIDVTKDNGNLVSTPFLINNTNGNVGIGTTSPSPSSLLELSSGDDTVLNITAANNKSSAIHFSDPDAQSQGIITYTHASDSLRFFTQNTEQMRIDSNGNVGIGTTDPENVRLNLLVENEALPFRAYRKTTTAGADMFQLRSDIGGTSTLVFRVEADGDVINATNSYTSDERAKTEISELNYGLDTVKQLQPKQFKMLHSQEKGFKYGFIAQQIETILPDVVRNDGIEDGEGGSYKALEYNSIIAVLTKAIQEQQSIIEDLKSRIETLESK